MVTFTVGVWREIKVIRPDESRRIVRRYDLTQREDMRMNTSLVYRGPWPGGWSDIAYASTYGAFDDLVAGSLVLGPCTSLSSTHNLKPVPFHLSSRRPASSADVHLCKPSIASHLFREKGVFHGTQPTS